MTYTGWSAGSRITAARLDEISGIWVAYNVQWTASTSNPTIGNGIIEGKYALHGGLCTVRANVSMGSTTTFGSGIWMLSLPFAAATIGHTEFQWVGSANALDRATAWHPGVTRINSGGTVMEMLSPTAADGGTTAEWTPTRPHTWANTDLFSVEITYEPA